MLTNYKSIPEVLNFTVDQPAALASVRKLFEAFALNNIRYCHWKSNLRLEHGMLGKTDMDLLVDPAQMDLLRCVLMENDIKLVLAPAGKRYPGIEDYLGFDYETGKLFHLHVHYKLVLGEQFVKNYHIPLEEQFLNSTIHVGSLIKIPTPELELAILCLRALLKYRDRDALKDILSIRSSGLPGHILNELNWLSSQTTEDSLHRVLAEIAHVLPVDIIKTFLKTIRNNPRDGRTLLRLRGEVRKSLGRYQRQGRLHAVRRYFRELWRRQVVTRFRPARGMTLPNGGLTISLVGADGSGKSTLSKKLHDWLSWRMDVHSYYLGSKKPSRLSAWLYLAFRAVRRVQKGSGMLIGNTNWLIRQLGTLKQIFLFGHFLSVGNDRYRRFMQGTKHARNGSVVLFDRFPYESPLDGPEISFKAQDVDQNVARFFSRHEREIYSRFTPPDFLIIMEVTPEVSAQRKPDHRIETIREKKQAILKLRSVLEENPAGNWVVQNADLPLEEVLLGLKRKIWGAL